MKYYDYYEFADEIEVAKRVYSENKEVLDKIIAEINVINSKNDELKTRLKSMDNKELSQDEAIEYRSISREVLSNAVKIEEKSEKRRKIENKINTVIIEAKEKLKKQIENKNKKIQTNENNIEIAEKTIEDSINAINEIQKKSKEEMNAASKTLFIEGFHNQINELKKNISELIKKSEQLLSEKKEIEGLYNYLNIETMDEFIKTWEKTEVKDQQPGGQQPGGQQPGGQQPGGHQPGGQQTPVQPKDVKINIGKEVTYSFKKDGKIIENSINLETFKGVLKQKIFKDIEKELCKKMNRKENDKAVYDLTGNVNPIVYEVLKRIDSEIGSDIPVYSENYLNAIIQDKSELFMADVVYDENQYKRRSILDRIKALPIINKALNKKEINTIERYADLDEKDKMARVIRKSNRNQKRLNKGQQPSGQQSEQPKGQQKHDDFVEKLHAIAKEYQMKIDDPDDKLTSQQMEQKNAQRKAKQQQTSTDYLDKEWEK